MKPRLGFLGVGWIGRSRMQALIESDVANVVAIADPSPDNLGAAAALAPGVVHGTALDDVLAARPDGVVIATPNALHADQAVHALRDGAAVFCQKPLGRNAGEVRRVVAAAREADRLLDVDFCYRHLAAMAATRDAMMSGELGRIYAAEFVFHNAYGPDKSWFYDRAQSGGGCLMDLGVHLVDLCLWSFGFPAVERVAARLRAGGVPLRAAPEAVEDYAVAGLDLAGDVSVSLACSWKLHLGRDAEIAAMFYGTRGGVALRNVGGSFYDFTAELYRGTQRTSLAAPPDAWGGRALIAWAARLAQGAAYDPAAERLIDVADTLDRLYQSAEGS